MALSEFQSSILRLLAKNRRTAAGSYVAGGLALNHSIGTPRLSRDIDIFSDSIKAMQTSWKLDYESLVGYGYTVKVIREIRTFIEAEVIKNGERTEIQWGADSAFRFFPLCEDEITGFTLHPIDLAANKLSALVGRTEPRDWIDVIESIKNIQPLVYLLSAACGKDPGFSPTSMLEYIARRRYNQIEIDECIIPAGAYNAAELCCFWREEVCRAREDVLAFPRDKAGTCVLNKDGEPFRGTVEELSVAVNADDVIFHEGRICGAWPKII